MNQSSVEEIFSVFDETARVIESELSQPYLEALASTAENIFHQEVSESNLSEIAVKRLQNKYSELNFEQIPRENIRKALQLAILKGMKEHVQPNHQMTPDGIGLLINYLVQKFMATSSEFSILDLAVGTGNLLTTILNGQENKKITAYGVDIDDSLLRIALASANLQRHPIQFFNQDSLEPLFIDPVDVVVADLPVGYYPNDERAKQFELKSAEGHSYAHHLFIEQGYQYVKEGGFLILIIPNNLFETDQSSQLHDFINERMIIQGLLQLPSSLFKNKQHGKSIFILQRKKPELSAPKQVLLVDLPDLTNVKAVGEIVSKMDDWFTENKNS